MNNMLIKGTILILVISIFMLECCTQKAPISTQKNKSLDFEKLLSLFPLKKSLESSYHLNFNHDYDYHLRHTTLNSDSVQNLLFNQDIDYNYNANNQLNNFYSERRVININYISLVITFMNSTLCQPFSKRTVLVNLDTNGRLISKIDLASISRIYTYRAHDYIKYSTIKNNIITTTTYEVDHYEGPNLGADTLPVIQTIKQYYLSDGGIINICAKAKEHSGFLVGNSYYSNVMKLKFIPYD